LKVFSIAAILGPGLGYSDRKYDVLPKPKYKQTEIEKSEPYQKSELEISLENMIFP